MTQQQACFGARTVAVSRLRGLSTGPAQGALGAKLCQRAAAVLITTHARGLLWSVRRATAAVAERVLSSESMTWQQRVCVSRGSNATQNLSFLQPGSASRDVLEKASSSSSGFWYYLYEPLQ